MSETSHFNEMANQWDSEDKIKMMESLALKLVNELNLQRNQKKSFMDFGCGTGLLTSHFVPYAQEILGIDTSPGMLEVFETKFKEEKDVKSQLLNLEEDSESFETQSLLKNRFDYIISSMAFHHLENPQNMIAKMKGFLKPGGQITVIDLAKEDGSFHPDNHKMGVKHFGFSEEEMSVWAKENELKFEYSVIHKIEKNNKVYEQFLAQFGF